MEHYVGLVEKWLELHLFLLSALHPGSKGI
jgi:hypothetical protein